MNEPGLSESVDLARGRLTALRALLEAPDTQPTSRELVGVLGEVQVTLEQLQARYGLLREILDRTNDLVFAKNLDGRYAMINPQGAAMFGLTTDEVLGADDHALYDEPEALRIMEADREVMRTGNPRTSEESCELMGVRMTLLTTTNTWYDTARNVRGVIGIAQDVTQRRRDETAATSDHRRMSAMAADVVLSEERLRRALAAELHDSLGQDIALAKMKLEMLRDTAGAELHDPLNGIAQLIDRADMSLRAITYQISPPSLHDLGLVAALQWLGEDVGRKRNLTVHVEADDAPTVDDERIRVILFRAVRELLANAATHSSAREVTVRIGRDRGHVRVTVEDAGSGFDSTESDSRGYGLFGIRAQLAYVDGTVEVATAPGHGTKVTLTAPAFAAGRPWVTTAGDDRRSGRDG